ncbi:glycosyltransferase [Photobacterium damselae]|uniref:glycosyltransferase n=1 Tax=Photobacterium damselae TaxID=38293 RepID=UPI0025428585|nr:glycosyltransferase [Photobacterium damselae]WIH20121.1 glycosyltransferase [Photobacterium damselae]
MKRLLLIDTTWPINSRSERFRLSLMKKYSVIVSAWSRDSRNEILFKEKYHILEDDIKYGNRLKKLISLPKFIFHSLRVVKKENVEFIFASHWDSLICAFLIKLIYKKEIKIIYDCLDLPTSQNKFILKILNVIEKLCLRYTSLTIFASRFYVPLYDSKINNIVFENYPSKIISNNHTEPEWGCSINNIKKDNRKVVSWIGVVRYPNILSNLLMVIEKLDVNLFVFGDGPSLDYLKELTKNKNLDNKVHFFGRYQQQDLAYIYEQTDFVWAAYPTLDYNSIYAISNKYFESNLFTTVPIFSKNTKMAENLKTFSNALIVDEYNVETIIDNLSDALVAGVCDCSFKKYEPDLFWEEQEIKLFEALASHGLLSDR